MERIKEKERVIEKIDSVVVLNISKKIVLSRISVKFPPFRLHYFFVFFFYAEIIPSGHTVLHKITKFVLYWKDRRFER